MIGVFVVHHNPNNGRYRYPADPTSPTASARALLAASEGTWVAGNCRRMIQAGDLLLFKFGGSRIREAPGIYAAASVTRPAAKNNRGTWVLKYRVNPALTRRLIRGPITGTRLARIVERSFGASIQQVPERGRLALAALLGAGKLAEQVRAGRDLTHGLVIREEPLSRILAGTKTWEIRGKATARRGPIALIQSQSGLIIGTCEVTDVVGPLSLAELRRNAGRTGFRPKSLPYAKTYGWVVRRARRLALPIPYRHPSGAVIWIRLAPSVTRRVGAESNA